MMLNNNTETVLEFSPIDRELIFREDSDNLLAFKSIAIALNKKPNNHYDRCCLKLHISDEQYQNILNNQLFNLKKDALIPIKEGEFKPGLNLDLVIELRPDLLSQFSEYQTNDAIIDHLNAAPANTDSDQELNYTENWYCLIIEQQQETDIIQYRTVWDYLKLSAAFNTLNGASEILQSLSNFLKETFNQIETDEIENDHSNGQISLDTNNFIKFLQTIDPDEDSEINQSRSISEVMQEFFSEDDWEFVEMEEESILQMVFEGDHGRWTCFALAIEENRQFVFYSLCPVNTPPEKISAMAQFLTKVNYGTTIGNFELNYSDGEIRYKTSIDVEHERFTTGLVNNLVYINVLTMDKYLPGIMAIINNKLSPDDAIAIAESSASEQE
ncbi:YbjN domain-containing protein [Planktothrix agardhii]|uniref:YbjN domain-containing protein n=1 Tax=Planktothrix agardhii TaxID=1160 RepID=UPI001F4476B1|nr:YbjN domain-containing protein [Planktothrix agardhii]MCF3575749.1 YbjN domain-containing protein [Planktothrix agardhii 1812]MCF3578314.1 YbjN domain-containing protein [Planktothrix agardhii 1812]